MNRSMEDIAWDAHETAIVKGFWAENNWRKCSCECHKKKERKAA